MSTAKFRFPILAAVAFFAGAAGGCCWSDDPYEKYYMTELMDPDSDEYERDTDEKIELRFSPSKNRAECVEEETALLEEGYERIGRSGFYGIHCPWRRAMDLAEDIGADLILLREHFREKETRTGIAVIPTVSTSQTSGSMNVFSPGGAAMGTYSGTTTTTSYNAVPYSYTVKLYNQEAIFFRKIKNFGEFCGAYVGFPSFLPRDDPDEAITLHVVAVVKGSRAWREGIRRGDVVEKVNGVVLSTRQDVREFLLRGDPVWRVTVKKDVVPVEKGNVSAGGNNVIVNVTVGNDNVTVERERGSVKKDGASAKKSSEDEEEEYGDENDDGNDVADDEEDDW